MLIIVMAGVALIGVLAALIFVLLAPASEDSGSDATPEPAEQAVEADERPAPVEAADSAEASLLERGPFEPGGLPAMATAIQRELGSVPRFVRIVATPTFAQLQVRLPGEGTFVDEWQWRDGELSDPEPVKVAIPERVPEASFTRREVRLAVLPRVVARAERIPIQDAEVTSAVIERAIPFEPGVRFLVNVSGTREDVQLRANSLGQVTEILR